MTTDMSCMRHYLAAGCLIAAAVSQIACGNLQKVEGQAPRESAAAVQPSLFTVPPDQMAHLQVVTVQSRNWQVDVNTTGTVDWDADHTTQAITQVNGPISRILVDTGAKVNAGDPLLYVSSPDVVNALSTYRKARNREVFNKRVVDRTQDLLARGAVATKDVESAEADYNDATTDVQNSLQPLKIFGINAAGDRPGREAGHRHQHRACGARANRRRGGAEVGVARHADPGRRDGLLHAQRRDQRLGAGPHLRPRPAAGARRRFGGGVEPGVRTGLSAAR